MRKNVDKSDYHRKNSEMEDIYSVNDAKLMTEAEVAALLHCSREKIKRLRLGGKLAYLKGRPILIEVTAVEAYLRSIRQEARIETTDRPTVSAEKDAEIRERVKARFEKMQSRANRP